MTVHSNFLWEEIHMKTVVRTTGAPGAIGPYSQAIKAGNTIYTSGSLPMRADGTLETSDIKAAVRLALGNLTAILNEAGATLEDVVKTTIFLTDLGDFTAVNEAYAEFFTQSPPARSCVQVAALPKGAPLEIEVVAVLA
jgi:2-iminobutanoate/2-iminopropanoate deaminase